MATVCETASYFDNDRGSRLFGVRTHASQESSGAPVVVFCHPIGEVKYSSYNAIVAFARRLATAGISSLRFDCTGFGDSEGETKDATITSCVADVRSAISMFSREVSDTNICLVGIGMGATIARIVAENEPGISKLVMIAPVVSGAYFRDSLLRSQQMSYVTCGLKSPKQRELLKSLHERGSLEVKGERFGKAFFEELSAIDLMQEGEHLSVPILIISAPGDRKSASLASQYRTWGNSVSSWLTKSGEFWSIRPEPSNSLPPDLFDSVAQWIGRTW